MSRRIRTIVGASVLAAAVAYLAFPVAASTAWGLGALFVGVGRASGTGTGTFQVRNNSGAFQESIDAVASGSASGVTGGCALDGALNVYFVNTTQGRIVKRALASTHGVLQEIVTGLNPQGVVVASDGRIIVGHKGGLINIYSYNGGTPQSSFNVTVDTNDSFWLDLAADQQTLFYTSGGRTVRTIKTDGLTGAGIFANLPGSGQNKAKAIRLLAPIGGSTNNFAVGISGAIVADNLSIKRLSSSGSVVGTYDFGSQNSAIDTWVAVGLDPKDVDELGADRAFWAGDFATGRLFRFNISSGAVEIGGTTPVSIGLTDALTGLCLNAEPTVGQFTGILDLSPSQLSDSTSFSTGTPDITLQHAFGVEFLVNSPPSSAVNYAINAREVNSDGACQGGSTNTTDVDCGFVTYFNTDPEPPKGTVYAHGRSVFYRAIPSQSNLPPIVVTIETEKPFNQIITDTGNCIFDATQNPPLVTGRALRILRDPVTTPEDQFQLDILGAFGVDEARTKSTPTNRFMMASRCSQGFATFTKPVDGITVQVGSAIKIKVHVADAFGNDENGATTAPHHMVATVGSPGQIVFTLGTPGNSPNFFNSIGNGDYIANLDTSGLAPGPNQYLLCIADSIDSGTPTELPLFQQQCRAFFVTP